MLARLRHDAFISSNHQRDYINSMRAREHVFNKPFVPRNVDKANAHISQIEISEPNVDGDATPLFFRQPIGVNPGKRAHQGRLAVIDMTCCADNYRFHEFGIRW